MADEDTSVRVAVRIRPQIARELIDNLGVCTSVTPGEPQVQLGKGNLFTYDHVFDTEEVQQVIYEACVAQLVEGALEGYNATVLAYGQTGSGKTYTMGTGYELTCGIEHVGMLPRAIRHIFSGIESRQEQAREAGLPVPEFRVEAQFIELYNENLYDLLEPDRSIQEPKNIRVHGDHYGGISVEGVTRASVKVEEEAMSCLRNGALSRSTGETQMNQQSSRSHAIYTLHIQQRRLAPEESEDKENGVTGDFETLTSKFHFVDLAGSERLHRTGATGERAKEGISINCGLLALGNVISALGDKSKRAMHVPYRDSKLTRLLQDSLGGNSRTVMIACISPSTQDFMETLSTLKYANRARNIKNRVTINQDKYSQQLHQLRQEVQRLQLELLEYKQGKRMIGSDGEESVNDMFHENKMLLAENNNFRLRLKAQQETIDTLTARNTDIKTKLATSSWVSSGGDAETSNQIHEMLHKYVQEVEDLTSKLMESEALCQQLRANNAKMQPRAALSPRPSTAGLDFESPSVMNLIEAAKKGLQREQDMLQRSKSEILNSKIERDSESSEDDDSDLDSDSDSEEEKEHQQEEQRMGELVCLESEINIKQQLIEQLELSQRRMHSMKQQYEEKLRQLEARMEATKIERDKVLASLSGKNAPQDGTTGERIKRVKEDYERKLANMQKELKTLHTAKKEHAKVLKEHSRNESQLRQLRSELSEMKKTKVRLVNKMREESQRHKVEQERRNRELAQLRKANRKHENQIRSLEAEKRAKDVVLKRRQEEVNALRRTQFSGMSSKAAGKIGGRKGGSPPPLILSFPPTSSKPPVGRTEGYRGVAALQRKASTFSPKVARQRWSTLEKNITQITITKKTIADLEHQLESHLESRRQHGQDYAETRRRLAEARARGEHEDIIAGLQERLKEIQAGVEFTQEIIEETQQSIMQLEDTRDGSEPGDFEAVINEVDELGEAKYLLSKLYLMTVNQSVAVSQQEQANRNLETRLKQLEQKNALQEELLQHVVQQQGLTRTISSSTVVLSDEPHPGCVMLSDSSDESRAPSPNPSLLSVASSTKSKARKRTADPQQMLYMRESFVSSPFNTEKENPVQLMPPPARTTSASLRLNNPSQTSPMVTRKQYDTSSLASPRMARRNTYTVKSSLGQSAHLGSMEQGIDATPPSSPPTFRRTVSREEKNVFSRLTSTAGVTRDEKPGHGVISQFGGRVAHKSPLICTHVAEGHSKAVLSVDATEDLLFSSSKDRTVKVWDLNQGRERDSLSGHPNNVVSVKFCERTGLVFSVSHCFVKVWDLRQNPARPIHTLCSSGNTANGSFAMPDPLDNPGGSPINDIALSEHGEVLYMAAGGKVRVWDLRRFEKAGQLMGGHQAAVMCLAVGALSQVEDRVITGSKDHYIKVFDVPRCMEGYLTQPTINLDPPHYDGVQSLALSRDTLFSGSRDFSIKKWDLGRKECLQSINGAHKDWVCGLALLHDGLLVSGCRGGVLKLWATESCLPLGEIKAHNSPINAVTTNSTCIFSASNCGEIRMWKAPLHSAMTMSTGHLFALSL
ncbi:kinesin-like protein KIF21A [Neocloeon triangulifer]|uniref:kinesin-like protein KIF21A n=1 Tax=Neocloeon triangulifer TaxID=2078957 RepID=UPI00286ED2B3|nr:kinesin-like protein KIF21A [Neocloeon triangulifer]